MALFQFIPYAKPDNLSTIEQVSHLRKGCNHDTPRDTDVGIGRGLHDLD